ncbi:MAG: DNA-binding protein [Desulfobacteraceae bacterium]|nr:DNA-binding protein [Desulfobacteraceae bacterium]
MDYRTGRVGRIVVARFDHGEDFLAGLTEIVKKEEIRAGFLHLLGGVQEADVVTGPREPVMPPDPVWREVKTRETLATGSIFWDGPEPKMHLHAALGHHGETITGCVRRKAKVYLVIEAYIFEILDLGAGRPWYPEGGFNRLTFS